ncbi:hypothetical protein [Alicyclobacillus sendaiensis]|uniref:Tetratricopeptide repeat protein n=1 Tax=Alicyclobacillus sendaiensis PA2 TaxID=3029425 RepID=A0ABT6XVB6_ALISE|nr:hypothetical protein [Alicyclobacillus sendaiensis]MDI9258767.1 hypothetical protein [Alicyclobacillus sendaiensis PA2]
MVEEQSALSFHQGMELYAMGEYNEALNAFLEEARSLEGKVPQRAGVAYRQAALCARRLGRMDDYDHYMRLAGREFLRASELPDQPAQHIREYALLAAQCFLAVENLDLSSKSVTRAKTVELALEEPMSEAVATFAGAGLEDASAAPADAAVGAVDFAQGAPPQAEALGAGEAVRSVDADALRAEPTEAEEGEPPLGAPDPLTRVLREVEARFSAAPPRENAGGAENRPEPNGRDGRGFASEERAAPNEPTQVSRLEASWVAELLDEISEIHAQMVETQRRVLELERRLHRLLREQRAEGRL